MNNKQEQPSLKRAMLVLLIGILLLAVVHQFAIPSWLHMGLQLGIILLMYVLVLAGVRPSDSMPFSGRSIHHLSNQSSTQQVDRWQEQTILAVGDKKNITLSLRGKM